MSWPLALCACAVASAGTPGGALAASVERLALLPVEMTGNLTVGRDDLEAAIVRGLASAGTVIVPVAEALARGRKAGVDAAACNTVPCWSRLGVAAEVRYLVEGTVGRRGAAFQTKLRLVRAADGATVGTEENQCDVVDCSVAELARRTARELIRRTLGRVDLAAGAPPTAAGAAPSSPVAALGVAAAPVERPLWPVLALGAGVAAIGTGVLLLTLHGEPADRRGDTRHVYLWPGVAAIGGGVALTTVGLVYIMRDDGGRGALSLAPALGPRALGLAGRF